MNFDRDTGTEGFDESRILRASDRVARPWRNGGGFTTEVLGEPRNPAIDNFTWRVSVATVEGDSDFSVFTGYERYLMPLSPAGLTLELGGKTEHIPQFTAHGFAGEVDVRAVDVAETSLDLNLMVRRESVRGSLVSRRVDDQLVVTAEADETVLVIVIDGSVVEGSGSTHELATLDAIEVTDTCTITGAGVVAIARVRLL